MGESCWVVETFNATLQKFVRDNRTTGKTQIYHLRRVAFGNLKALK